MVGFAARFADTCGLAVFPLDDLTKAIKMIEERRAAPGHTILTKDINPANIEKADGESGILTGYASDFGVVDSYAEVTAPGAFAKSISERGPDSQSSRIHLRFEHDYTIGRHVSMVEDERGLKVEALVSDDGMWGSAVRAHLRDGVPYGMSIGFRRISERPATEADRLDFSTAPAYITELAKQDIGNITVLTEVKLLENSVVTFPAVESALVTDYRSTLDLTQKAIERIVADIKAGRLTDDHLTQLRQIAADLPAGLTPDATETVSAPRGSQTAAELRNYPAELALAEHMLARLGITL